ncbi:MAG: glycosyltransferase family 4 protein [Acidobacteriota bacterium]
MSPPGRLATFPRALAQQLRYRAALLRGLPAGGARYRMTEGAPDVCWSASLALPEGHLDAGLTWVETQTLPDVTVESGDKRCAPEGSSGDGDSFCFYAPGLSRPGEGLPDRDPSFLEVAAAVLVTEDLDAVVLGGTRIHPEVPDIPGPLSLTSRILRRFTVFRTSAWSYDPEHDAVVPLRAKLRIKSLLPRGAVEPDAAGAVRTAHRRGSYLSSTGFGPVADLRLRDASDAPRLEIRDDGDPRPRMLVLAPFLARGGAEHTIYESLFSLRDRWHIAFVTLAPHRPELDDRRGDFQAVWPRLLCLGDLVHPAAMPGLLASTIEAFKPQVLYNANSTTLFFDFLPEIRRRFPELRILDHLYDHRVGYIERYGDPALRDQVDAIVAENRRIAETLAEHYDWPADRAPVVWPCGRPGETFETGEGARTIRRDVRRELGIDDSEVVLLTAARMHPQKRPLDLIRLAERLRDVEGLRFLIVGGGELEDEVDREAADAVERGARILRLPFRDDIPRLVLASDAGCLVSDYEGLPVFLLECLQAGRPFLGTDVGDLGFVVRSTGAGWIVDEPGDLDRLESAARELARPGPRAERAERALRAARHFSVEACAERYDAVFRGEVLPEPELAAGDGDG